MMRVTLLAAALLLATGCAHQPAPEARLGVVGPAIASDGSSAVVVGTLLNPGVSYRSGHHTMVNLKGAGSGTAYHDYSVLFGPHDPTYPASAQPEGAPPAQPTNANPQDPEAIGMFRNSEPSWTTQAGYALLWGWWPIGYTPTVRVVTEGRGVNLILVEKDRERIVRISGVDTKISLRDNNAINETIASDMWFVDVTWDANGNPELSNPAQVPAGSLLEEAAKKALERKGKLVGP